jgi:hypothetical protein
MLTSAIGERIEVSDRLSVTLTLLLTMVALKFSVSSSLPQVRYPPDSRVLVAYRYCQTATVWDSSKAVVRIATMAEGKGRAGRDIEMR